MERLRRFLTGREPQAPQTQESLRLLPWSVLYALQYREATLGHNEVRSLLMSGFQNLGFYLAMKAAEEHDSVQVEMLGRMVEHDFNFREFTAADAAPALGVLAANGSGVGAKKLAEISRTGFKTWGDNFDHTLGAALTDNTEAALFIVANATYVGLDVIASHSLRRGRPLHILKPSRFSQTERPVGFVMEQTIDGTSISPLHADFPRPAAAIVFDDVMNRGTARQNLDRFWQQQSQTLPQFVVTKTVNPSM